ncbi:MAG TPA: lamin tail domain-containing protein [Polyangia bacterium]|jgi:hypothetical protein
MLHRVAGPLLVSLSLLCAACGPAGEPLPTADGPVVAVVDAARSTVVVDRATGVRADGADTVTITVTTRDASGAPVAGVAVYLTVSGSGNFYSPPAAPTDADGVATATLASTVPEQKTITTTAGTGAAAVALADRPTVTFVPVTPPPTAVKLGFLIQPTATVAGAVITPAVRVAIQDATGETVTSATAAVTLALAGGPAGAALGGTRTVATDGGVATFADLNVDRAGAGYTIVASAADLTSATSGAFAVTAAPATHLGFVAQPASFAADAAGSAQVGVLDATGAVVTGATGSVTLTIASGPAGATLTGGGPTAVAGGLATFTIGLDTAGTYTLQASGAGVTAAVSQSFDVGPGATAALAVGLPVAATAGAPQTVTVTARDARGNTTPGYTGTIAFTSTDPQAVLPANAAFAAGDAGVKTFTAGVTLKTAGSRTVTATDTAHAAITGTQAVAVGAAAATRLVFTAQPAAAEVATAITPAVVVAAQDPYGNADPAFAGAVTVSLDAAPAGAHLSGATAVTAAGGVATFGALVVDVALAGYRLRAAAGGLTDGVSAMFDAWAAPAAGDLVITEVMHTPGDHATRRQWLEVHNVAGRLLNLAGLSLTDTAAAAAPSFTISGLTLTPPGDYFVLGAAAQPYDGDPYVNTDYQWPAGFVLDETAGTLVLAAGATTVASLAYDAAWPSMAGHSLTLAQAVAEAPAAAAHRWYWCDAGTPVPGATDYGTPGAANDDCGLPAVGAYSAVTCALAWPDDIPQAGPPVVWPLSPSVAQPVTARFSIPGVTTVNQLGNDHFPYLVAALGYGASADPSTWTWLPAGPSPDAEYHGGASPTPGFDASFDEAKGLLQIATPGSYRYGFRVGLVDPASGGVLHRYCGRTGPVSATDPATWADFATAEVVAPCAPSQVVIRQVYGGGGNAGATYKCDFVELKNRGVNPVSLAGWSVQYASDTGSSWLRTLMPVGATIPGGGSFLVQESCGPNGSDLPTPDLAGGTIAMAAAAGKIALVSTTTALTGTCPTADVVDFVGYGATASCAETTPTPNLSATTSAQRAASGCTDTSTNSADFTLLTPAPLNSASAPTACGCGS